MNKLISTIAVSALLPVALFVTPVGATNEGQIEGGNIYRIKNITKNVDFTTPANADACDVVQYKVRIHNPGPGILNSVKVNATLPSGAANSNTSTVTISSINANPASTSGTAVLNISSVQEVKYVSGSTKLLDANGNTIKGLADGVTQGGVDIGTVGVSLNEKRFVEFDAKVNCPTPPTTPETPKTTPPATSLPNTGPGNVVGIFAGVSAVAGTTFHFVRRRTV